MDGELRYHRDIHLLRSFTGHHLASALGRKLKVMNEMFNLCVNRKAQVGCWKCANSL